MSTETMVGKVLYRVWGSNDNLNDFYLVVDEMPKTLVLLKLPKKMQSRDGRMGIEWPIVPELTMQTFLMNGRFRTRKNGSSLRGPCCSYQQCDYYLWDGKPRRFKMD